MKQMVLPPEFWKTLSKEEDKEIFETGMLNYRLCKRLWAMLGRTDQPPHKLMVLVREEDLMRLINNPGKSGG